MLFVHLEGGPSAVGFQHGYLLAPEIEDSKRAIELSTTRGVNHNWGELRVIAQKYFLAPGAGRVSPGARRHRGWIAGTWVEAGRHGPGDDERLYGIFIILR